MRDSVFLQNLEKEVSAELERTLTEEELLWRQKSRVTRLQAGERNTRFFHLSTLVRRRRNRITRLMDDHGQWIEDDYTLRAMVRSFYLRLYTSEQVSNCRPTRWSFPVLSDSDQNWLNRSVSALEIKEAIFHMPADKAPGPDGYTSAFFQKFWPLVEQPLTGFLLEIFRTGLLPEGLNESVIYLLPKCTAPSNLNQFRPISLSNVLVKVVSKVLATRLKPLMNKLTGPFQTSFIPGRQPSDNITAAQEAIHSLRRRKSLKEGFVLKVDLEMAYDRIEWSFLAEVLSCSGFNRHFSDLIMTCIQSVSLGISWNGQILESFQPSRGLR